MEFVPDFKINSLLIENVNSIKTKKMKLKDINIESVLKRLSTCLIILALFLTACQEVLEEQPKTVSAEYFYNTAEEVQTAVNAIYVPIRSIIAEQTVILDAHTDWGYGRGSRADYSALQGLGSGNINISGNRWNAFYLSIRNANLVIKNAPSGTSISQDDINKNVAEAKFMRAFSYFQLVRNWGSIPLRTEENMTEDNLKKSSVDDVYTLIISDLVYAENNLPKSQSQIGRPNKYSVMTMLADVYLTLGKYTESSNKAKEVIQASVFSLVPAKTKTDFQLNIFGPEIVSSTEEIFYFKFSRQTGQGNWIDYILNHSSTGNYSFGGAYAHYSDATNLFYKSWDDKDLRKSLWDQINFGLGATTLVSSKYIDSKAISTTGAGNDLPIYRYADVLLIFAEASCMAANGPTSEGIEALNKVHRRAYGKDPNAASSEDFVITNYNATTFQDLVLQERAYEFIFEGKRWYDLKRTKKAAEIIKAIKGITIAEKAYLWPIPVSELNYNKALDPLKDQNPGY